MKQMAKKITHESQRIELKPIVERDYRVWVDAVLLIIGLVVVGTGWWI